MSDLCTQGYLDFNKMSYECRGDVCSSTARGLLLLFTPGDVGSALMFPPLSFISQLTKLSGRNFLDSLPEVRHRRRRFVRQLLPNPSTKWPLRSFQCPCNLWLPLQFISRSARNNELAPSDSLGWAARPPLSVNSTEDTLPFIQRPHCSPGAEHLSEETLQTCCKPSVRPSVRPSRRELRARGGHWGVGKGEQRVIYIYIYIFHGRINTIILQVTSKDLPSSFPSPPEKCYFFFFFFVGKLRQPKLAQPSSSLGLKGSFCSEHWGWCFKQLNLGGFFSLFFSSDWIGIWRRGILITNQWKEQ